MKLKSDFVLHELGDDYIVVPVNERTREFHGMIKLNKTGAFLWKNMGDHFTEEDLISFLLEKYDVDNETAKRTVNNFLQTLLNAKIIID